ncbi:hypothetical protein B0H12DRAFT_623433 [Mycena haematopus]|nr:hypothetical protein B0H12DRAFT_623433 [Mycena haematopus]
MRSTSNVDALRFSQRLPMLLDIYGPSLRDLLSVCNEPEESLQDLMHDRLATIKSRLLVLSASDRLETLLSDPEFLTDEFSDTLLLTYGVNSGLPSRQRMRCRVRSPLILRLILQLHRSNELRKWQSMYHLFKFNPRLSVSRAWVLEILAHERICAMTFLTLFPVTKQGAWFRKADVPVPTSVSIGRRSLEIYTASSRFDTTTSFDSYYVPAEGNNPTFDSFIPGPESIAFQMSHRSFKAVGANMVRRRLRASDETRDWLTNKIKFVFVVPLGHELKVEVWEQPKDMDFWVLELDIDIESYSDFRPFAEQEIEEADDESMENEEQDEIQ